MYNSGHMTWEYYPWGPKDQCIKIELDMLTNRVVLVDQKGVICMVRTKLNVFPDWNFLGLIHLAKFRPLRRRSYLDSVILDCLNPTP